MSPRLQLLLRSGRLKLAVALTVLAFGAGGVLLFSGEDEPAEPVASASPAEPTEEPSAEPTEEPTEEPSSEPTEEPVPGTASVQAPNPVTIHAEVPVEALTQAQLIEVLNALDEFNRQVVADPAAYPERVLATVLDEANPSLVRSIDAVEADRQAGTVRVRELDYILAAEVVLTDVPSSSLVAEFDVINLGSTTIRADGTEEVSGPTRLIGTVALQSAGGSWLTLSVEVRDATPLNPAAAAALEARAINR